MATNNWMFPRQLDVDSYVDLPLIFKYDERYSDIGNYKKRFNEFKWNAIIQKVKGELIR